MLSKPHKVDTLILVKNISFSDLIKLKKNKEKKDFLIVALDPKSQAFLKNKNLSFVTSEVFLDSRAHKEILIESKRILEEYHPIVKVLKFGEVHECIQNYVNYNLLFKIREWLVLLSIINNIKMKEIIAFGLNEFISNVLLKWSNKEDVKILIYSVIASKNNFLKQIIFKVFNLLFFEYKLAIYNLFFKKFNKNQLFLTSQDRKLSTLINKVKNLKKEFITIYLSSNTSFFFKNFLSPLNGKVIIFKRIYSFITKNYKSDYLAFKKQIRKAKLLLQNKNRSKHQDFYLYQFLDIYLQKFILNEYHDLFRSYIGLKRLLKKNEKNNLLFLSQHALGFNGLVGELAMISNVTSLLITHGSHVKHPNKYSRLAWDYTNKILINAKFTYTAMQTPIAYEYFCNEHNKRTKPLITGPMIYGIKNKISSSKNLRHSLFRHNSKKFIILHAGTPKDWNFLRPINYETIDEYISNIIKIINAIKNNNKIFLAIKFRQSSSLSLSIFKTLLPKVNNYEIYHKGNFMDYLRCSDLLVSYSSTTIEEALINEKPVALFNPNGDYFHLEGALIKDKKNIKLNHIYNIKNSKDLEWGLSRLQEKHFLNGNCLDWKKYSFDIKKNNQFEGLIHDTFKNK